MLGTSQHVLDWFQDEPYIQVLAHILDEYITSLLFNL